MPYEIKDHGTWSLYEPDPMPEWALDVPGRRIAFSKRDSDGLDWYEYRKAKGSFAEGSLLATTMKSSPEAPEIVMGVFRDHSMPFPDNMRIVEISGVDASEEKPWKLFEQRIYDPATQTIGDLPEPVVLAVRDYQFAGQAAAEEIITDAAAMAWVATGKTPDTLIAAVKAKVTDPDRQKRVLLFLAGTTSFPIGHELTPLLAASFGKDTPEKLKAFFLAASQR